VGRPPQELMRGWGRVPIYKDSRPNHELGNKDTHNIDEGGKKGRCDGHIKRGEEGRDGRQSYRV
jgi:hypothetical protein